MMPFLEAIIFGFHIKYSTLLGYIPMYSDIRMLFHPFTADDLFKYPSKNAQQKKTYNLGIARIPATLATPQTSPN